jgi:hypothetical protein
LKIPYFEKEGWFNVLLKNPCELGDAEGKKNLEMLLPKIMWRSTKVGVKDEVKKKIEAMVKFIFLVKFTSTRRKNVLLGI